MKFNVIIPCGGSGTRTGLPYNKLFADLGGIKVIERTIAAFCRDDVAKIIIPCSEKDEKQFKEIAHNYDNDIVTVRGGATRGQSVKNALAFCDAEFVAIHDGARPFVSKEVIDRSFFSAERYGASVACVPVTDSIRKKEKDGSVSVDRSDYYSVQTPQVFRTQEIKRAYDLAEKDGFTATDDAAVYERYIGKVSISEGDPANKKITTAADFAAFVPEDFRVGTGWDTHALAEGRKLILGGTEIPHTKGLVGHSDADVLVHAVMDAVLGAIGRRDIGKLFPDTDPAYKGADSMKLLEKVISLMTDDGYRLNNLSAVIMAQKPKLSPYIPSMAANLAKAFSTDVSRVNVAATTTEKLGMVGREEGMSAICYCSLVASSISLKSSE